MADKGRLKIQCFKEGTYIPIDNTKITVTPSMDMGDSRQEIVLTTSSMGETDTIELDAPPNSYSQEPTGEVPYSTYDIKIDREGFNPIVIKGTQIFPEQTAIQPVNLIETGNRSLRAEVIEIGANVLNGNYPEKIPEEVEKVLPPPTSGVVLPKPVVPEYIVVHAGSPNNTTAPDYKVKYKDYIKNVASSEIYSTWSSNTIRSNVYAIISFTLNRIYTEWYRGKGKSYDITNSTAYDHAFNYGRNIYENISVIVDEVFATYVRRFNRKQPLLTQYCDGKNVSCPEWMTQWGSKYLGDKGKAPYEILTHFYGNDIELVTAEEVKGIPKSFSGFNLTLGTSGQDVKTVQEYLNRIAQNYPLIPKSILDGVYGEKTKAAVMVFQGVFNLPKTGVVDYGTWYKISDVYVGVTRIAELRGSVNRNEKIFVPPGLFINYNNKSIPRFTYVDDN